MTGRCRGWDLCAQGPQRLLSVGVGVGCRVCRQGGFFACFLSVVDSGLLGPGSGALRVPHPDGGALSPPGGCEERVCVWTCVHTRSHWHGCPLSRPVSAAGCPPPSPPPVPSWRYRGGFGAGPGPEVGRGGRCRVPPRRGAALEPPCPRGIADLPPPCRLTGHPWGAQPVCRGPGGGPDSGSQVLRGGPGLGRPRHRQRWAVVRGGLGAEACGLGGPALGGRPVQGGRVGCRSARGLEPLQRWDPHLAPHTCSRGGPVIAVTESSRPLGPNPVLRALRWSLRA